MRRLAPTLALLFALLQVGCAHLATPSANGGDRRLMVTLSPAPPALLDRTVADLARIYGLQTVTRWYMASIDLHCVIFEVEPAQNLSRALNSLAADPRVGVAQPVQQFEVLEQPGGAPNAVPSGASLDTSNGDPYLHLQHAADTLNLAAAHSMATGNGVRLAVIDTGVDFSHPELRQRVTMTRDFTQRGGSFTGDIHGTAITGVIVAAGSNGIGILGVAPEAEILALKACWPRADAPRLAICDSYSLALALDYAIVQQAQVLNLSLAGPEDEILSLLIHGALRRGIVVVAAATRDSAGEWAFPASVEGVIGVCSISPDDKDLPSTQFLTAPGTEILSTVPGGAFDFFSGSSLAAAHVSGVAALVLQHRADMAPGKLAALLRQTSRDNPGHGVVDACAAVAKVLGRPADCG